MSSDPTYTVFIRLPFPRGDFIDPPSVEWDASKDKALWKILSKASKNSDIDWNELATRFEVTLAFLLQQAAWLYERQLLQVRAQMRKVGVSRGSAAPSPVPWTTQLGSPDPVDSGDDEPAFMPIQHQDPSATLRGDPRNIARNMPHANTATKRTVDLGVLSQTSDSSASSTPATELAKKNAMRGVGDRPIGPLSPRRTVELSGQGKGSGKGSDGTPSMGSSFSDLDDASVTQSALEEALASNMQAGGGMASRMSQALRSKYF
ncbi:hypothetical protein PZA11_006995 [Diplocarpon coronariae]